MKTILRLVLVVVSMSIYQAHFAQVDVRRSTTYIQTKPNSQSKPDSTDIDIVQGQKYVGDTVILYQNKQVLNTNKYDSFRGKSYDGPLFAYFKVTEFNAPQQFGIKELETGETYYFNFFGQGVKPVMSVKYYQSYKSHKLGSEWCLAGKDGVWRIIDVWLEEGAIAQTLQCVGDTTTTTQRTMWGDKFYAHYLEYINLYKGKQWVVDSDNIYGVVDTIVVKKGKPLLAFKDGKGNQYLFDIDKSKDSPMPHCLSIGLLPTFTKEDAQKYIRKFGLVRWKDILSATAKVGMTEEMLYLAIGKPIEVNTIESQHSIKKILHYYTQKIIVSNGKVVEIWSD